MKKMILLFAIALAAINLGALFVEIVWPSNPARFGFFRLDIYRLDQMPYWLFANICLIVVNGIALIHNSAIRARRRSDSTIEGEIPFTSYIILGYNLVAVPVLILLPRFDGLFRM